MKWFVTDAQLAALRAELSQQAHYAALTTIDTLRADHAQEIQRLREDRAMELARLADPTAPFLAHLKDLVATLRRDVVHERQRAEVAIDVCREAHEQIRGVTLPPRDDRTPREFPASEESALAGLNIDGM
jgi:hypothetical protein